MSDLTLEELEARDAAWRAWAPRHGVPRRLLEASVRGKSTAALTRATHYVEQEFRQGCCLVLTGPTGVGKSYAAVAALRAVSDSYSTGRRFDYFPALCGRLLNPETRTAALEAAKVTPFLLLDDFGVEYVKEGGLIDAFLDEIVWAREAEILPTIITTNLTTDGLKQRLPQRLIDRLRGDWGRIFECPGESLR